MYHFFGVSVMKRKQIYSFLLACVMLLLPCSAWASEQSAAPVPAVIEDFMDRDVYPGSDDIPAFQNEAAVVLHNNIPDFYISEITTEPYVRLSPLDELGRTGTGMACLCAETLPTEERGQIGNVQPSGWQNARYDDLIEDHYLYNRCHVLGYQLCGDNATPENLFTGTRYLNVDSMLYFENQVAGYLTNNKSGHVIYRVTPVYNGEDLVPAGVQMEAFSVDDYGKSVCFNVFVYNIQPGVEIDYATGESKAQADYQPGAVLSAADIFRQSDEPELLELEMTGTAADAGSREMPAATDTNKATDTEKAADASMESTEETAAQETEAKAAEAAGETETQEEEKLYIRNTNTRKVHDPTCTSVSKIKAKNKEEFFGTREKALAGDYEPCQICNP